MFIGGTKDGTTGPAESWPMHDVKNFIDMDQQINDYDEGETYEDEPENL